MFIQEGEGPRRWWAGKRENDRQKRHKTKKIRKDRTRLVGWREMVKERKEEKGTARSQEGAVGDGGGREWRGGATAGCFGLSDG